MEKTGKYIVKEIQILEKLLQPYEVFVDGQLTPYVLSFLQDKLDHKPLRAYYCRKIYEYISGTHFGQNSEQSEAEKLYGIKLPFVFEVVIVIQYLHNHVLDDKYDIRKGQATKVNQRLLSSNLLREILFQYFDQEVKPLLDSEGQAWSIRQEISRLLLYVDLGQRIDKDYNHYLKWIRPGELPPLHPNRLLFRQLTRDCIRPYMEQVIQNTDNRSTFVEGYFQRLYLTNVYLFECMTKVVLGAWGYKGGEEDNLYRFSTLYGYMLQIINDYADFAYSKDEAEKKRLKTAGKKTTDFFSDLYNFNITLPLIYHLSEGGGGRRKIEAYLERGKKRKKILTQYPIQIVNEIKQSGAISKCIALSRQMAQAAKTYLDIENPMTPYFTNMCDIAMDNKFYQVFR